MSAPSVSTRGTIAGAALQSGFKSKFSIGLLNTFAIWEFEITPGAWDGGEPISQSTFFNTLYHTSAPQTLIKIGPFKIKGKYDPDVFKTTGLAAIVNKPTNATLLYPNLGTLSVFGYVKGAVFGTNKEGELPTIELEFQVTNWDPVGRVEAGPSYVDGYTGTADS